MPSRPVLRFAPSPNGYLHLGHALSALVGYRLSRKLKGKFLIRIEDIDRTRSRENYISAIFEDLQWLGLTWERDVLRQSQEAEHYLKAAARLSDMGLLYPCFATRSEILAAATAGGRDPLRDPDGAIVYPGLHRDLPAKEVRRRLAAGERPAMRIRMDLAIELAKRRLRGEPLTFTELAPDGRVQTFEAQPQRWGDAVIQRKDFPASYHLAVVVDDARQNITHVTRGRDLFASTSIHRLLQVLLDLPEPIYHHHRLLYDSNGNKLSKSHGSQSLRELRAAGWTPAKVIETVTRDNEGYGGDVPDDDH